MPRSGSMSLSRTGSGDEHHDQHHGERWQQASRTPEPEMLQVQIACAFHVEIKIVVMR